VNSEQRGIVRESRGGPLTCQTLAESMLHITLQENKYHSQESKSSVECTRRHCIADCMSRNIRSRSLTHDPWRARFLETQHSCARIGQNSIRHLHSLRLQCTAQLADSPQQGILFRWSPKTNTRHAQFQLKLQECKFLSIPCCALL
jgi:hypothetical protein